MDEPFGEIGYEVLGRKSIRTPVSKTGNFEDPPVPRAVRVIGGCMIAMLLALLAVSYFLMMVDKPSTRPSIFAGYKQR